MEWVSKDGPNTVSIASLRRNHDRSAVGLTESLDARGERPSQQPLSLVAEPQLARAPIARPSAAMDEPAPGEGGHPYGQTRASDRQTLGERRVRQSRFAQQNDEQSQACWVELRLYGRRAVGVRATTAREAPSPQWRWHEHRHQASPATAAADSWSRR